ncbi:MAG: transcription-repair coupling factor [Bdellovibrionaceae bacterium]|nr:transcription-repair coupling factor [Pseudobdellovibrionaceae bacterium]
MNLEPLRLHFESVLERALKRKQNVIEVVGTDSTLALALFLSQATESAFTHVPQLILVPTAKDAVAFSEQVRFFDPEIHISILPAFDVSPYSGLYPNTRVLGGRVRWLNDARRAEPRHLFVAPIEAVLQKTMPVDSLLRNTAVYKVNDDLPSDLARHLNDLGFQSAPVVEDEGTFAIRGGIVDIFSPAHVLPVRIELFGDTIDSMRFFNPETQRSEGQVQSFTLIPPREVLYNDITRQRTARRYSESATGRNIDSVERDLILHSLVQGHVFPGVDFLLGDFYEQPASPLDFFEGTPLLWQVNPLDIAREADTLFETLKKDFADSATHPLRPDISSLYQSLDDLALDVIEPRISLSKITILDRPSEESEEARFPYSTSELRFPPSTTAADTTAELAGKVEQWREEGQFVFVAAGTTTQCQRLKAIFEKTGLRPDIVAENDYAWSTWREHQRADRHAIHLIPRSIADSIRIADENLIFLRDDDFFGQKRRRREYKAQGTLEQRTHSLSFGDLKPGDAIVHVLHGIGIYEGLKVMPIQGVPAEFIQLSYKDGDKLYLPIYRIAQISKYSGPNAAGVIDKLGGTQWQKTKIKVRHHLRELASELLALYAKRSQVTRSPWSGDAEEFHKFEAFFPYDETDDQLRAVSDIEKDLLAERPMDRLVCGDVGFGKTEVAMRAAFMAVQSGQQVAVLAPTTVLTFQHLETFQKRFRNWPLKIRALNRFVPPAEVKKTLQEIKDGQVDICIGTHRLLSKDVQFKNLGMMIVDEEQKFGVTHKERIKKMRAAIDTLTLSATPIPRTLNMSLVGMRDLSIINTPPVDRLPTRTFVCKYDEDTIRKAILSEIHRGGQVFFLHNRVQSIYATADEIRRLVPEARLKIGHGQMEEEDLEKTMVSFFNHEIDVLVCTTIIESGIDNPRANTMFIDDAHMFGLSQLYQLRGRVGRSKERAYCYLIIPPNKRLDADAQERLKVIQENTALGSGMKIAHHDLELRGAGNLLGEDQSGHIDSVGYELYLELLEEAIHEVKGEPVDHAVEPDINVRIPAFIPDEYIPDIRIRLSYYKAMAEITQPDDMDRIEDELRDQFGKLPDQTLNLMGLMLIRHHCRELGIRDLSSGTKTISLAFTEKTPLPPEKVVRLAQLENKKFSLTPDNRLIVRLNNISWPNIYEELLYLKKLC